MTSIQMSLVMLMSLMVASREVTVASAQQFLMGSAAGYLDREGNSPFAITCDHATGARASTVYIRRVWLGGIHVPRVLEIALSFSSPFYLNHHPLQCVSSPYQLCPSAYLYWQQHNVPSTSTMPKRFTGQ
jgi:hypothetical protein